MSNEKFLKGRFQQKTDIEKNWEKAKNFIPLDGEIIVYKDIKKLKVGDGVTVIGELEFYTGEIDEKIFEDYVTKKEFDEFVAKINAIKPKINVLVEVDGIMTLITREMTEEEYAEYLETMKMTEESE